MKISDKFLPLVKTTLVLIFLSSCQTNVRKPEPTLNVEVLLPTTESIPTSYPTPTPVAQFQMPQLETVSDISNMAGNQYIPLWSPDGTKIVFVSIDKLSSDGDFGENIYLMNSDGSQQTRLTESTSNTNYSYPSWSLDGSSIIYVQGNSSKWTINTMSSDGSQKTELVSCDFSCKYPRWSADRKNIIYFETEGTDSPILIVKYDISSGQKNILYQSDSLKYFGGDLSLSYSPDEKSILFHTSGETQIQDGSTVYESTIYIMDANGNDLKKIINGDNPSWHPDGTKIIFGMYDSYQHNIYISNPDGTDLIKYASYNDHELQYPVWSPSGDSVLFVSFNSASEIDNTGLEIFVVKTKLVDILTQNTGDQDNAEDNLNNLSASPEVCSSNAKYIATVDASLQQISPSPDMSTIAFISKIDGDNEVYVMNIDEGKKRRITDNQFDDMDFTWFPDGKKLAVLSNQGNTFVLYFINFDNPTQKNILAQGVTDYDISPNGKSIAYTGYDNTDGVQSNIYIMDADGSNKARLFQADEGSEHPVWSPDGSKIYFRHFVQTSKIVGSDYGGWEGHMLYPQIMSINRDGTDAKVLTDSDAADYIGSFSPDGQTILFVSDRDQENVFKVYKMGFNGENQVALTGIPSERAFWWPDGDKISVFHLSPETEGVLKISDGYVVDTDGNFLMELPKILKDGFGWLDNKRVFFSIKNNDDTNSLCVAIMSDLIP